MTQPTQQPPHRHVVLAAEPCELVRPVHRQDRADEKEGAQYGRSGCVRGGRAGGPSRYCLCPPRGVYVIPVANGFAILGAILGEGQSQASTGVLATKKAYGAHATVPTFEANINNKYPTVRTVAVQ